jgi:DNA-directed RNA polymerase subunit F
MSRGGPGAGAGEVAIAFARRLAALDEGGARRTAAARLLAEMEPALAALAIAALARGTGADHRTAIAAVGQALAEPAPGLGYERTADIYAAAAERGLVEVTSLFVAPPAHREWVAPRDKPDPRLARLTLGHKKAMARANRDPDLLARLAAEGEPSVVRELLRNAQLTEPFAVRIAARRPIRPETLRCFYESRRWRTRPAVVLAVVKNPYVETEVALKLLAFLGTGELEEIATDGALHPLVRQLARKLVAERSGER